MKTLKSIGAILTGFIVVFFLSIVTDIILSKTGIMKTEPFDDNPDWLIIIIIIYRCIYNITGSFVTAKLAPDKPMRHAMIGGIIGFVLTIVGLIVMWDKPPHWYPIMLIILALPCAWAGGKIQNHFQNQNQHTWKNTLQ